MCSRLPDDGRGPGRQVHEGDLPVQLPTKFEMVVKQDRHGARSCRTTIDSGARGRGDRIKRRVPSHGPNGKVADSLDEAKAAFRAAWGALDRRCARARAAVATRPKSSRRRTYRLTSNIDGAVMVSNQCGVRRPSGAAAMVSRRPHCQRDRTARASCHSAVAVIRRW
jgi:hypothetical protein